MYRQVMDPLGSPALTALAAALPLLVLLVLLGVFRIKSHVAGLLGLVVAVLLAVAVYRMPLGQAVNGAAEGAAFGVFPIVWIILNAVWVNKLQRSSGHFDIVERAFSSLSSDRRVQALLIAYCFGSMIESLSGFGTPIALTSIMLIGVGFKPLKAAVVATFANTAPAAFGSVGNPIQALAKVTAYSQADLASTVGRQSAVIAFLVPFALLLMLDGRRGLRETWPAALAAGMGFGAGQYLCSNFFAYQLADIAAGVIATVTVIVLLRFWSPGRRLNLDGIHPRPAATVSLAGDAPLAFLADAPPSLPATAAHRQPVGAGGPLNGSSGRPRDGKAEHDPVNTTAVPGHRDSRREVLKAFAPYALLTVLFGLASVHGPIQRLLTGQDISFAWPGLHVVSGQDKPLGIGTFDFGWLSAPGTMLLFTGVLTALILRVPAGRALRCYAQAFLQIRWAIVTISCVLALSYVMNLSGMAISLGTWLAGLGSAFALLSGFLGWFGVALTGSDTSSNALFGAMQVAAAHRVGISPLLMSATNSTGGVQGKAAAMQNLAIGSSAVGMSGREGDILRKVLPWSLGLLAVFCVFAWLQSTSVLSWMVP